MVFWCTNAPDPLHKFVQQVPERVTTTVSANLDLPGWFHAVPVLKSETTPTTRAFDVSVNRMTTDALKVW